jgi:type VI secretion system secreted protein VgrG
MSENPTYRWNLELQRRFLQRELCHLHGFDYAELTWARETLTRLETTREEIGYSYQDHADQKKARDILDKAKAVAEFYDPDQPRDAKGRWTSLDVQKALGTLQNKIDELFRKGFPYGDHKCATFVREALAEGGIVLDDRPKSGSAKDYGSTLQSHGFNVEAEASAGKGFPPDEDYRPQAGDVAVIQGTSTNKDGHMALYSGRQWISDFNQREFWPGPVYRDEQPRYVIYRHKNP